MHIAEEGVTYIGGLIALALIVRYANNVNQIITSSFSGISSFSTTLLNPGSIPVMRSNTGFSGY